LRYYFKDKRDLAVKLLKKYFKGTEVEWINPKGGIFILLNFPPTVKVKKIIKVAKENHNLILENDQFTYLDGISRNQIRINFVKNNNLILAEGIFKLYQSFKEVQQC
jgi:DNA-binding transcriptional MocR family regulator